MEKKKVKWLWLEALQIMFLLLMCSLVSLSRRRCRAYIKTFFREIDITTLSVLCQCHSQFKSFWKQRRRGKNGFVEVKPWIDTLSVAYQVYYLWRERKFYSSCNFNIRDGRRGEQLSKWESESETGFWWIRVSLLLPLSWLCRYSRSKKPTEK